MPGDLSSFNFERRSATCFYSEIPAGSVWISSLRFGMASACTTSFSTAQERRSAAYFHAGMIPMEMSATLRCV